MSTFPKHTAQTASETSRRVLERARGAGIAGMGAYRAARGHTESVSSIRSRAGRRRSVWMKKKKST
jgi:hypothetical protein